MQQTIDIEKIWISPGHDFKGRVGIGRLDHGVIEVDEAECVAGRGIRGDRYFDYKENFKGQLTLISREVIESMAERLGIEDVDPSACRRNILVSGVDLNTLIGQRFTLGEVVLTGSEECKPCFWMDEAVSEGAFEALKGRGGLRCRIETTGVLQTGRQTLTVESLGLPSSQ